MAGHTGEHLRLPQYEEIAPLFAGADARAAA
jgi:hypothetical protein